MAPHKGIDKEGKMAIYFGVILFLSCLSLIELKLRKKDKITKKVIEITVFLTILFLAVLRKETVGGDIVNYKNSFLLWRSFSLLQVFNVRNSNVGFVLLNWLVGRVTDSIYGLMIASAVLTYGFWFLSIRKFTKNISMSAMIFIALGGFARLFSELRQSLAMAFLFYGVTYLVKGKHYKYIFWLILAASIHSTALIGILYLAVVMTKRKDWFYLKSVSLVIGSTVIAAVGIPLLLSLYRVNDLHNFVVRGEGGKLLLLAAAVMLVCYARIRHNGYTLQNIDQIAYNSCLVGTIIQILALGFSTLTRLTSYFFCFFGILIPNLLMKEKRGKEVIALGVLGAAILYFYYGIRLDLSGIVPYEFFWQ